MKVHKGDVIKVMLPVTDEMHPMLLGPFTVLDVFEDDGVKIVALD